MKRKVLPKVSYKQPYGDPITLMPSSMVMQAMVRWGEKGSYDKRFGAKMKRNWAK